MVEKKALHMLLVDNANDFGNIPQMTCCLANAMAQRGHSVTIFNQRPVSKWCYPLYKMGHFIYRLSMAQGQQALPMKGCHAINELYPFHASVKVESYNFSDKNAEIQELRQRIRTLAPDVCVPMFADVRQFVWAVILLGSGVPYLYTDMGIKDIEEQKQWSQSRRFASMSGADRIHLGNDNNMLELPDFLQENVRIIPSFISCDAALSAEQKELALVHAFDAWEGLFQEAAACKGGTRMDAFMVEPFASMARLAAVAQREYFFRDFGCPIPNSVESFIYAAVPETLK